MLYFSEKIKSFFRKVLTVTPHFAIISFVARNDELNMREWRNRQTRTFEGRVVIPYGFKSRLSHQQNGNCFAVTVLFYVIYYEIHGDLNPIVHLLRSKRDGALWANEK